ncbi:MAG: nitroreductase family protein [Minisyncoccia bacterium]|jgi:nitroreductase
MIVKEILNRRAVREYKSDDVSNELITEIIKAGQFAPNGRNIKANEFIVVRNAETKRKIFNVVGQDYVKDAPVLVIPVSDTTKTDLNMQDLALASGFMFLEAAALGLGTVWKNIKPEWEEDVRKILNIPPKFKAINIIPVGFPKEKIEPHGDSEFSEMKIHRESW